MPNYGRGDKIKFVMEDFTLDLFGMVGVVAERRRSQGHYVYDVRISGRIPTGIPAVFIGGTGLLKGIPASWFELDR